jgi:hypothetical protein
MEVGKEYEAHIVDGNNSNDQRGLYLVFIPELNHNNQDKVKPFWVQNCIPGNNFSRWKDFATGEIKSAGSYTPLASGMVVVVKFRTRSLNSGYIDRIKTTSPMLLPTSVRDQQYVISKTAKNSYIIQDDSTGETHIVNANGKTNIIMDNNRILLKVTEGAKANGGTVHSGGFEVEESGMTYTIGNVGFRVDETGIIMNVGDNIFSMTESGISCFTKKMDLSAESKLNITSQQTKITGMESMSLFSNDMKITGNTVLNLTGHNIKLEPDILGSLHLSGSYIYISSLVNTSVKGTNVEISGLVNTDVSGPILTLSGQQATISAPSIAIDGSAIMLDGMILGNMGAAKAVGTASKAMNIGLAASLYAAYAGISFGTFLNDPISGSVNSILVSTVAGSATPVGNLLQPFRLSKVVGADIVQKLANVLISDNYYKTAMSNTNGHFGERITHGISI